MTKALVSYSEQGKRWEWSGGYETRTIPKQAKWRWDPTTKKWWTDDKAKAAKLSAYASEEGAVELGKELEAKKQEIEKVYEASRSADANIDIPVPDGLEYLPFQRAGVSYALDRQENVRGTLIGDDMGLGKTIQAIGYCNEKNQHGQVDALVICPASLKVNWAREFHKWLTYDATIVVWYGDKPTTEVDCGPDAPVVWVMNYELLKRHQERIRVWEWTVVIIDEAHYLKNGKAQRTKEVIGKWERGQDNKWVGNPTPIPAKDYLFLTGTPMLNRPAELWTLAHFLAPKVFDNWFGFVKRYCAAYKAQFGWVYTGHSNEAELERLLRENFMVRRKKTQVLTELPAKTRQVVELPVNGAKNAIKKENKAYAEVEDELAAARAAVELARAEDDEEQYKEAVANLRAVTMGSLGAISAMRRDTALAKIPYIKEHVMSALECGPVVFFCHHKAVARALAAEFKGSSMLTGDTPAKQRQHQVDRFQNGETDLFIGTIQAAGVGVTLVRSCHVIFGELDWTPGWNTQAEDRCHRIGQENSVLVQHLVFDGSLDATIAKMVVEKQEVLDKVLDEQHERDYSELDPIPMIPGTDVPPEKTKKQKQIEKVAAELSHVQIAAIHESLRHLSQVCDGANAEDGMGFSKIDTLMGKSLAALEELTPKQAAVGMVLTNKYRRQLTDDALAVIKGEHA